MMDRGKLTRYLKTIRHYHTDKKVKSIEFKMAVEDLERGEVNVTDFQLQEGNRVTGSLPNTREILKAQRFGIDESHNAVSGENVYLKESPRIFENVRNRFFNFANRGHAVMAIPNVYHEDYRVNLLPTALDLTIIPKDDYDFLRVSTNYGGLVEDNFNLTYPLDEAKEHPLNYRYTKEFCFGSGKAGDEIQILTSKHLARVNGTVVPMGVQMFPVGSSWSGGDEYTFKNRQRFMSLPWGSTRIRIEFYKMATGVFSSRIIEHLKDTGIGYYGVAEFSQWVEGISKF